MISNTGIYLRPQTLREALTELAARPLTVLAGGTDFYATRAGQAITEPVLDITAIPELKLISDAGTHWRIGATVTWSQIVRAAWPAQLNALQLAARDIGAVQVQNRASLAGNICNASPAADGIVALLALDAQVELAALSGQRRLALTDFVLGARKTARLPSELVTGILVPIRKAARSSFLKLGQRRYLVISIAMVAVLLELDSAGAIVYAAVAVGSCSAVAQRLPALERRLLGQKASSDVLALLQPEDLNPLTPIDDVRGSAAYRRDVALTLVKRALSEAIHAQQD